MQHGMVWGVVGEQAGGKGAFVSLVKEILTIPIGHFRSSEPLQDILKIAGIPFTRPNCNELACFLDRVGGVGTLSRAVCRRIAESTYSINIFDGIRWQSDVDELRRFPGSVLIYVTADMAVRYQRAKKRPEKADEAYISFEEFRRRESLGTEKDIALIGKQADYTIVNNEDDPQMCQYRADIFSLIEKIKKRAK